MRINRKQFLGVAAGSGAGLVLAACGGGGYGGSTPASSCGSTIGPPIHGHTMTVAVADVNSTVDKSYDITGTANHSHSVTLTAQQLAQLKAGTAVSVTSTAGGTDGHTHAVAVNCTIY